MIDFHTHTFLSDGDLIPSELVQRARAKGYRAIGIADHADGSNIDWIVPRILKVAKELNSVSDIFVVPGVEITHAPPSQIGELVNQARKLGAVSVLVHGETLVEPVEKGTNLAAIEAKVDILAHPGLISHAEVQLAVKNGVHLEITARSGHSLTNGHVASLARQNRVKLVIDTDTHSPENLIDLETARRILRGAGLSQDEAEEVIRNNQELLERFKRRMIM